MLVVRGKRHVAIQVKESRYYIEKAWKSGHVGHSWQQIKKIKFEKERELISISSSHTCLFKPNDRSRVTVTLDDPLTDYSGFLNAWDLVKKALE